MLSRRALLAGGVSCLAWPAMLARARNSTDSAGAAPTILRLERRNIEVNGKTASVYGIRQPNGTFGVTTEVGKPFRVRVENGIDEPSLIHWHGLTPPWRQDGVPGISGPPIPAGGSADYDFPLRFGGTFWMHSHQGLQEQRLMTAPLIIHDQRDRPDAGSRGDAGRFQLHAVRTDLRKSEEVGLDGGHDEADRRDGFDVEHEDDGADVGGQTRARS
jgi:FtsP/CotA-like multicopper oxidase with cupredoxin domain